MDLALEFIESMLPKFRSEMRGILKVIDQISEEDIIWSPNADSNSIANLIAHIRGCVHSRIGPLSIDWTARIEKITQLDRTFVRIERA